MENPTNTPEEKPATAPNASAPTAQAQTAAKTGNLADTDSEYKHKHGEHHHHHHHHRHHHRHFHPLNLTPSGIWSNLKLLAQTVSAYPYVLLFLAIVFLFFMESGLPLKLLEANRAKFATAQDYFAFQDYIVQNKSLLVRIPFQFTLVVAAAITAVLYYRAERHWQRNIMKLLPALGAAAVLSIPMGGRAKSPEEVSRSACRDSLRKYHEICIEYAERNDGKFPDKLSPEKPAPASTYGQDHFIYSGAGRKASEEEAFILIEDKSENHIGNIRFAIRSDGVLLLSKYGQPYQVYQGKSAGSK